MKGNAKLRSCCLHFSGRFLNKRRTRSQDQSTVSVQHLEDTMVPNRFLCLWTESPASPILTTLSLSHASHSQCCWATALLEQAYLHTRVRWEVYFTVDLGQSTTCVLQVTTSSNPIQAGMAGRPIDPQSAIVAPTLPTRDLRWFFAVPVFLPPSRPRSTPHSCACRQRRLRPK